MKKITALAIAFLFLIPFASIDGSQVQFVSNGHETLYVGGDGPNNYTSIQAAIDDAHARDTIFVYSGVYYEEIEITKAIQLTGEHKDTTIIDGDNQTTTRICVNSDNVVFNNFTVRNAPGDFWTNAITVYDDDYVRISNCTITQCDGLAVWNSSNVRIENCNISDNLRGMDIDFGCNDVTIRNCIISHNLGEKEGGGYLGGFGIDIDDGGATTILPTNNVSITNCSISHNRFWGIALVRSSNVVVSNCHLDGNDAGVLLYHLDNCTVSRCDIYGIHLGIDVANSTQMDIKNCSIQSDDIAIRITDITADMPVYVTHCNITDSRQGVYLFASRGTSLHYNNIRGNGVGLLAEFSLCDARYNYWGSELGPSRLLGLRGDRIMNRLPSVVRYFPWLKEECEIG